MTKLNNDEAFKHINYHETNLHKTFARVRKQRAEAKAKKDAEAETLRQDTILKVRGIR